MPTRIGSLCGRYSALFGRELRRPRLAALAAAELAQRDGGRVLRRLFVGFWRGLARCLVDDRLSELVDIPRAF